MRLLCLIAAIATLTIAQDARADSGPRTQPGEVTQLLLLDGYRAAKAPTGTSAVRRGSPKGLQMGEKEETLAEAVQRMWSQVRAYRRPGGAEVYVRGIF